VGGSVRLSGRDWQVRVLQCVHGMNIHGYGPVRGLRCVRGMNIRGRGSMMVERTESYRNNLASHFPVRISSLICDF
jgi:hypothetical protein